MTETNVPTASRPKSTVGEFLDSLSKTTIVALFAIYVFGYLVVSIHEASYGFGEGSPLKPRIVAAGALFLLFVLVPVVSAKQIFSHREMLNPEQRFSRAIIAALGYFFGCSFLAGALSPMYVFTPTSTHAQGHSWPIWAEILLVAAIVTALTWAIENSWKSYRKHPMKTALLSGLLLLGSVSFVSVESRTSMGAAVALWFFGIGVVAAVVDHLTSEPERRKRYDWTRLLILVVAALTIFPSVLYPRIKSSWGGGSSISVVVYFSPDSRILPGQQMKAELLDESDNGIYVIRPGDTKALYVPRAAVSALYFSGEPLSPEFLKAPPKQP